MSSSSHAIPLSDDASLPVRAAEAPSAEAIAGKVFARGWGVPLERLHPLERHVIQLIDGVTPVTGLVWTTALWEHELLAVVASLAARGLIRERGASGAPPAFDRSSLRPIAELLGDESTSIVFDASANDVEIAVDVELEMGCAFDLDLAVDGRSDVTPLALAAFVTIASGDRASPRHLPGTCSTSVVVRSLLPWRSE